MWHESDRCKKHCRCKQSGNHSHSAECANGFRQALLLQGGWSCLHTGESVFALWMLYLPIPAKRNLAKSNVASAPSASAHAFGTLLNCTANVQPLVVQNVWIPSWNTAKDVVFVATEANTVHMPVVVRPIPPLHHGSSIGSTIAHASLSSTAACQQRILHSAVPYNDI